MSEPVTPPVATSEKSWWQVITPYQWIVLIACYAGGMFDGLDSSLFTAIAKESVSELTQANSPVEISHYSSWITALFLTGWTLGGTIFGMLGDKIGRVKALSISILIYALFTGMCGLAHNIEQLMFFRFMTALGIGGELIVGTTLVAESWPEKYRAQAVGFLTTAYQLGYCLVGAVTLFLDVVSAFSWRYLFLIGALPALIVMVIRSKVNEPDRWLALHTKRNEAPSAQHHEGLSSNFWHLFDRHHLKRTLAAGTFTGTLLVAYWASTFWIPTWIHQIMGPGEGNPVQVKSVMMLLIGGFALFGCVWSGFLVNQVGRRITLLLSYLGYIVCSIGIFATNTHFSPILYYWAMLMGVFVGMTISLCYIYVPELFPTRLRASGTGFCFNLGRLAAAGGVIFSSHLVAVFDGSYAAAALSLSFVLILGMIAVFFTPETKGHVLPD